MACAWVRASASSRRFSSSSLLGLAVGLLGLVQLPGDGPLAVLGRLQNRREGELLQQEQERQEDDPGPEEEPEVDRERRAEPRRGVLPLLGQQQQHGGHGTAFTDELEEQREHQRDDRGAFQQHREQQAGAADIARRLRLTRDRLGNRATDAAQANAGADDRQTDADAGAEPAVIRAPRPRTSGACSRASMFSMSVSRMPWEISGWDRPLCRSLASAGRCRVSRLGAVTVIRQCPEGQRISPAIRLGYQAG